MKVQLCFLILYTLVVHSIPIPSLEANTKNYQLQLSRSTLLDRRDTAKVEGDIVWTRSDIVEDRATDGGVFAYGDSSFYGSMGSVDTTSPDQRLSVDLPADSEWETRGWDWEVEAEAEFEGRKRDDAVETNVKKGFITVDVVSEETIGVEYQTPAFHVVNKMKEGERGVCASCLRNLDDEKREDVFVHWSKREARAEAGAETSSARNLARNDWNTDIPDHEIDDLDKWIHGRQHQQGERDIVDDEVNDLENFINSQHDWSKRMERANAKGSVPD
ncbi:hypothetical protein I302_104504 [Kwoniella bestiolae CBS 10118]|uniref:Uncharacterized protein n=1 Tax=Kwoniella bestiolae CBS 10118 TaxID=1296100 RepID=A0A1B9GBG6_9TREE|nr:hypothetical protein I302_03210 [Kwoniella bestiolae CBS 10118]OCF28351.1 hypothetical protein I302_03210 [Kwoniella bestiolae CBS 10118]